MASKRGNGKKTNETDVDEQFLKDCNLTGGGVEQQPRGRQSAISRTKAESHRLAAARLGS